MGPKLTFAWRVSLALLILAGAATRAAAQAPSPTPASTPQTGANPLGNVVFGATFEGYYEFNGNRPPDRINVLRAYDTRANVFGIQQAALIFENAPDVGAGRRFGMRVDLQFGQATDTVQGNAANEPRPAAYRNVWQAYGTYIFPVGRGLQVDFGKFGSNLGYETNYAKDNNNFSRAYLFNYLPFYHSGVRTTLPINDKVTVMYMLTNGVQQSEDFNNFKSNHFTAIVKPISSVSWTTSFYAGQEQPDNGQPDGPNGFFKVFDSYVSFSPSGPVSAGVDVTHVTSQVTSGGPTGTLTGLGAYLRHQTTTHAALSLRYEWLNDKGGLFGGIAQRLQEMTLGVERKMDDGFLARLEYRRDWSDHAFFPSRHQLEEAQNTVLIGLVWWMGGKKGAW